MPQVSPSPRRPRNSGVPELTIVRGPDEWSTAEAAARWLSNTPDHEKLCIIAGDSTTILDHELSRRGTPTLGIPRRSATSPAGQVLPVFLSAILPPTDIRRVAEFLNLSFGTPDAESPAKALIPRSVSKALLNALTKEPGLSGDTDSAWMKALRDLHDRCRHRPRDQNEGSRDRTYHRQPHPPLTAVHRQRPRRSHDTSACAQLAGKSSARTRPPPRRRTASETTTTFITEATTHLNSFLEALAQLSERRATRP